MPLKNLSIRRLAAPFWGKRGRVTAAFQQDRTGQVCIYAYLCACTGFYIRPYCTVYQGISKCGTTYIRIVTFCDQPTKGKANEC